MPYDDSTMELSRPLRVSDFLAHVYCILRPEAEASDSKLRPRLASARQRSRKTFRGGCTLQGHTRYTRPPSIYAHYDILVNPTLISHIATPIAQPSHGINLPNPPYLPLSPLLLHPPQQQQAPRSQRTIRLRRLLTHAHSSRSRTSRARTTGTRARGCTTSGSDDISHRK